MRNRLRGLGLAYLTACALMLGLCSSAAAAIGEEDPWGGVRCTSGEGAGECRNPRGIGANPVNGHLFVADQINRRVDEFNALGQFLRMWGWDVVEGGGTGFEICVPSEGDTCKSGEGGSGAGQLNTPLGVALDSEEDVFVVEYSHRRIEKFDSAGNLLLEFGEPGTGPGQFSWGVGNFIAIDSEDNVYVGDEGRVQRFDAAGAYQDECFVPTGETVTSLAVDASGDLYAGYRGKNGVRKLEYVGGGECKEVASFALPVPEGNNPPTAVAVDDQGNVFAFGLTSCCGGLNNVNPIFEFNPEGEVIEEFGRGEYSSTGLATNRCEGSDPPGNLYVSNTKDAFIRAYGSAPVGCFKARTEPATDVEELSATLNGTVDAGGLSVSNCRFEYGTDKTYGTTLPCTPGDAELSGETDPVAVHADIAGLTKATTYHFRILAKVGSEEETGGDVEFKTKGPPAISEPYAASVLRSEASLKALVNPEGFATSCSFEYGTASPSEHGTPVQAVGADRVAHQVSADLTGLSPGQRYLWRIACQNSSGSEASKVPTIHTYLPFGAEAGCANQAFRTEASALLPDCRAYEMVSPTDKSGGDVIRGSFGVGDPDGFTEATPEGNRITYTTIAPFGARESAVNFNQYLAERGGEGWSGRGIDPEISGHNAINASVGFNAQRSYMAFTPDLCQGWLVNAQTPPLTPDAVDGYMNLYRREECGAGEGGLEALTDVVPPAGTEQEYIDKHNSLQGTSIDGSHALFAAKAALTPEAPEAGSYKLYDRHSGAIRLTSVLPNGTGSEGQLGAGEGWLGNLASAVSEDGELAYWTRGRLYLRIHPEQGPVAGEECKASEPETAESARACTVAISPGAARFWAASPNGRKAIYTEGGTLYEFDLDRYEAKAGASIEIADEVQGVAGASRDLSRVYFVSRAPYDGGAEGEPNLYLAQGGAIRLIATLSEKDVGQKEPGANGVPYNDATKGTLLRATRVSADGSAIAFNSRAPLDPGYDNTDTASGKGAVEVYLYDASSDALHCASCNPGGARPQTEELRIPYLFPWDEGGAFAHTKVPAAAFLPTWEQPTYASRPLSANGDRLFFNSYDALLPRDTNGQLDVYEWEAPGAGSCTADEANPSYFPGRGGCLYLISSGESANESEFWEASEDGSDVFFTTESRLLASDPGSMDLYDARVGGGFPQPGSEAECEGEACQSPPGPPESPTPASEARLGDGNVTPGPGCGRLARRAHRLAKGSRAARHRARALNRRGARRPAHRQAKRSRRLARRARALSKQGKRCRRRAARARRAR